MTTPQISIHNALTGEVIVRDMNPAELAQYEKDQTQAIKNAADKTAKQSARQAVLDKLGLTADEVAALLG